MSKGLEQCDKCDYFISVEEAYKQGRADVIDELIKFAHEDATSGNMIVNLNDIIQLKER